MNHCPGAWEWLHMMKVTQKSASAVQNRHAVLYFLVVTWWRHQMETFSALHSPVTGEFPAQRPVTHSFDVFFDLRLNKQLSKQPWGWLFETLSRPLWRHCNYIIKFVDSKSQQNTAKCYPCAGFFHYGDVILGTMASQITSIVIVYSTVYSGADQRKHQSSASLAFVRGIHRGPVNSPHKWPVTQKMFPFDDVIMLHALQATSNVILQQSIRKGSIM